MQTCAISPIYLCVYCNGGCTCIFFHLHFLFISIFIWYFPLVCEDRRFFILPKRKHKMKINGKVHCFFEQSGTFKNEFIKLGIHAEDYDIQNNFGETDHIIDLFAEIEKGYEGQPSLWDEISTDDLIMAFFPCIFFCENNQLYFMGAHRNLERYSKKEKADTILKRSQDRAYFYELALKMFTLCDIRGIRVRPIILPHDYWKPMSEPSRRNRMGRTILYIYLIHLYGLTILYAASVRKTK